MVVFNTCAVRENADNRLYGNLGHLAPVKTRNPGMQIAVGGCLAQKDRGEIVKRAPWVDVVFGTHNIGSLPVLLERARHNESAEVEILESLEVFPSTLPTHRESTYSGWVSISVGCNNTCTFCIVPSLRGTEKDRRPGDVLAEVRALVETGVLEVTLLGQNVNSYGVEFGDKLAFGKLLRATGEIDGLERVRFTSPHPKDFTDDVIAAMAETPNVCHQLHMPLQSGSDSVLRSMRRSYRRERYLGIIDRVRSAMPDAAITTDIIVGFPGETEDDFEQTLEVVRAARFASAFTFQYSKRPGTPAATMDGQVPKEVVADRYRRLMATLEEITWAENSKLIGTTQEVLVAVGEGRKDGATGRMSGRARDGRLVHFATNGGASGDGSDGIGIDRTIRPGDIVHADITYAAPHHLNADGAIRSHRRTRAGDAYEAGHTTRTPGVVLGMPTVGAPRDCDRDPCGGLRLAGLTLRQGQELPLAVEGLLGLADALGVAGRLRPVEPLPRPRRPARASAAAAGWPMVRVRRQATSIADRIFSSTARQRRSRFAPESRGDPAGVVPPGLDLASAAWAAFGSASTSSASASARTACRLSRVAFLLGVAGREDLAAAREEGVLRGPEPFPQPLLDVLGRARRGLPLGHQLLEPVGGRVPLGRVGQRLGLGDQLFLATLRLLAGRVEGGEVGAAAAGEGVAGGGVALPQLAVGLLVDAADRLPLVEDRLEPVAGRLPAGRLGGDRSRPPRPARSCGPAPRPGRRRGRRAPRPAFSSATPVSFSSRADRPSMSPTTCASGRLAWMRLMVDSDCAASAAPLPSRASMRSTSVTRSAKRRAKWARPSSGVPACHDPTTRSPSAVLT